MIIGHGIDLQEISAIERAYERNRTFAKKILTNQELVRFEGLIGKRKIQYLAGRWAAKEALGKALRTGVGPGGTSFQALEILQDDTGAPCVTKLPIEAKAWVSISHSGDFVQASVVLEEKDETK